MRFYVLVTEKAFHLSWKLFTTVRGFGMEPALTSVNYEMGCHIGCGGMSHIQRSTRCRHHSILAIRRKLWSPLLSRRSSMLGVGGDVTDNPKATLSAGRGSLKFGDAMATGVICPTVI